MSNSRDFKQQTALFLTSAASMLTVTMPSISLAFDHSTTQLPTIELNLDVVDTLGRAQLSSLPTNQAVAPAPILHWQKGPEGQTIAQDHEPAEKKILVKKLAAAKPLPAAEDSVAKPQVSAPIALASAPVSSSELEKTSAAMQEPAEKAVVPAKEEVPAEPAAQPKIQEKPVALPAPVVSEADAASDEAAAHPVPAQPSADLTVPPMLSTPQAEAVKEPVQPVPPAPAPLAATPSAPASTDAALPKLPALPPADAVKPSEPTPALAQPAEAPTPSTALPSLQDASAPPIANAPATEKLPAQDAAKTSTTPGNAEPTSKATQQILFNPTETTLPLSAKSNLDSLAKQLKANEEQRITLTAYASGAGDQASTARRVSLSRALAVRAYLIDQGVSNLRINVQAEGSKNAEGAPDRVDIFINKESDKK